MSTRKETIIIATGMDNTAMGDAIRSLVGQVKNAGKEIERGFMPETMTRDLVTYYRKAGKASGAAFKEGQRDAGGVSLPGLPGAGGGGGGIMSKLSGLAGRLAAPVAMIGGTKYLYGKAAAAGKEARNTQWEAEDAGFSTEGYQAFLRSVSKTGGDAESAKTGLMHLVSTIGDAREGSTEAAAKFAKWGVTLNDSTGSALSAQAVYGEILERLEAIHDPTRRASMMMELLGRNYRGFIDAIDKTRMAEASEWVHKFAPTDKEVSNLATMGQILISAAKDNIFTRFGGMVKQIGRQSLGGMLDAAGVNTGEAELKGKRLDARLEKINPAEPSQKDAGQRAKEVAAQLKIQKDHQAEVNKAHAEYRDELEQVVPAEEHLKMLKEDEKDLQSKFMEAARRGDDVAATKLQTELLKKQQEVKQANLEIDKQSTQELDRQTQVNNAVSKLKELRARSKAEAESGTYLSTEQIAGTAYTERLQKAYGKGGVYDLGRGDSPMAAQAQELERMQYATQYDRMYGSKQDVDWDVNRMTQLKQGLIDAGVRPDDLSAKQTADGIAKLVTEIQTLNGAGKVLNTRLITKT
ncbi:MAG: hypothetical protein P4N60_00445 [Verrucomicrobiae bacterium]|nr:hypothetical protein [Verrucomicrobiae bacterium]